MSALAKPTPPLAPALDAPPRGARPEAPPGAHQDDAAKDTTASVRLADGDAGGDAGGDAERVADGDTPAIAEAETTPARTRPGPRRVTNPLSPEAFRSELEPLIPQVRAFARFLCQSDRAAADDLAQEALLRAWQARASFEPGTQLRAWLFVIVRNLFYSDRRRAWRNVAYDETAAERTLQTKSVQAELMELDDVRRALALLPDDQREALILVTAGGLSYDEAAHICGCAVGTIKSRVNRGRRALAQILETQTVPPRDAPAENALGSLIDDARRIAAER